VYEFAWHVHVGTLGKLTCIHMEDFKISYSILLLIGDVFP
jgi:hypothetical protein